MPSSKNDLVQASLQEVKMRLHSTVHLRHFSEHQDEASVRKEAKQVGDEIFWKYFMRKVKVSNISMDTTRELVNAFCSEMKELVDEYVNKNQDCRTEAQSFLEKKMAGITEDFQTSLEAKFLMNPDMDLKFAEEILEDGKFSAMSYFERMWKHGSVGLFEEYSLKMEKKLQDLKKEMLEKQSRHLENKSEEDARKSLNEVKEIVLEMSRHIKYDLNGQEKPPLVILKEGVQGIHDYLIGKGKVLNGKYGKLYSHLLRILKDAVKCLDEAVEDMSVEDATRWSEELNVKIKVSYSEYNNETSAEVPYQESQVILELMASNVDSNESHDNILKATEVSAINDSIGQEIQPNINIGNIDEIVNLESGSTDEEVTTSKDDQQSVSMETNKVVSGKVNVGTRVKRGNVEDVEVARDVGQPAPKKFKEMPSDSSQKEAGSVNRSDFGSLDLNTPDEDGKFALLRALEEGQSVARIKKLLDDGANVNVRTNNYLKYNAAHQVIWSLINKKQNIEGAIAILDLLVAGGFMLINGAASDGFTPLLLVMQYADLDEQLLSWFHKNGADFNAVENKWKNSVLFQAIDNRQSLRIIQKVLGYGGIPKHVNKWNCNVLHKSAKNAHESALKFFIEQVGVNERAINRYTPLHFLFDEEDLDYYPCLEMLLRKRADFGAKDKFGCVPLAHWINHGKGNIFPVLVKLMKQLPITQKIASATLTAIVKEIDRIRKFLPSSSQDIQNEFVQFILFLIGEKRGALRLKDESKWQRQNWEELKNVMWTLELCKELWTSGSLKWKGLITHIKSTVLGKLDFHTKSGKIGTASIEIFLLCLLREL